jgi:hypothetical protein
MRMIVSGILEKVMTSRLAGLTFFGLVLLLLSGVALQRSSGWHDSDQGKQERFEGQARNPRKPRPQEPQPPGPGRYLAFDVRPRDHQTTIRYVLEVTHPSGQLSTYDLKKPKLQRRTIMVPVPDLAPGKYQLVVIAENEKGASRSQPLAFEIRGK